jgi:hypothetical protein
LRVATATTKRPSSPLQPRHSTPVPMDADNCDDIVISETVYLLYQL